MSSLAPSPSIPGFSGPVTGPSDPGYDEARSLWNRMHDRRPALIARAHSAADVAAAIAYARTEGLELAVRGGGHSLPGYSTVDGAWSSTCARSTRSRSIRRRGRYAPEAVRCWARSTRRPRPTASSSRSGSSRTPARAG